MLEAWDGALKVQIRRSGTLGFQGLMVSRIQGQQVSGNIRLKRSESTEIGDLKVLRS